MFVQAMDINSCCNMVSVLDGGVGRRRASTSSKIDGDVVCEMRIGIFGFNYFILK
jgi:hypothetical protein